jgi:tripartite-type tricarboxylate transporter receptor subunit TctC
MKRRTLLAMAALSAVPLPRSALAGETAAGFYDGAKIRWIVPYRPGGGYDQYSRLLAPYAERYSGARIEIVNMPGGGGMKGAVEIFRSPPDGLHVAILNGTGLVGNAMAGTEGATYDVTAYSYIGRISSEERVLVVSATSGLRSFDDIRAAATPAAFGATGRGGSSYVDSVVTARAFGYGQRLIAGFESSADVQLAMLRGDVAAMWGSLGSAVDGIAAGEFIPVLRSGGRPDPLLDGVPSVADFAEGFDDATAALVEAWLALCKVGRPLVAPPGVPEDRLAFLRDVLRQAMNDPELVAQSGSAARELDYLGGEEMLAQVRRALDIDARARAVLVAAIAGSDAG